MSLPLISLSVPVYGTESSLPNFFDSILEQHPLSGSFAGQGALPIEILIVNDGSPDGSFLPKILKPYKKPLKKLGVCLELLEHGTNLGTFEARRTAVQASSGSYIFFADPDDTLPPDALHSLYTAAVHSDADIIHGRAECKKAFSQADSELYKNENFFELEKSVKKVRLGVFKEMDLLSSFLLDKNHSGLLCTKLFRSSIVKSAFADIPHTFCTMTETFLIYFFILLYARSYCGIEDTVYTYHIGTGITSSTEISSLDRWEKACTAASVFTVIFSYLEEHPLNLPRSAELFTALEGLCRNHARMNIRHLERVIPSLQAEAYAILCDYWGEDYVKQIEKSMKDEEQKPK